MTYTIVKKYTDEQLDNILSDPHTATLDPNSEFELTPDYDQELFTIKMDGKLGYVSILIGYDEEEEEVYLTLENEEYAEDNTPDSYGVKTLRELYDALVLVALKQVEL